MVCHFLLIEEFNVVVYWTTVINSCRMKLSVHKSSFLASFSMHPFVVIVFLLSTSTLLLCNAEDEVLSPYYYRESCPYVLEIVREYVEVAIYKDPRLAASLLRLHFHDCFVMGCDASILLDSNGGIVSEKQAGPNLNSLRGFEVIDIIKALLEEACPLTVSCADILAIAARDAIHLRGGPSWVVDLGRKDSLKASFDGANKFIPSPNSTLQMLVSNFQTQGLDIVDLVSLSGSHTIGRSRCLSFKARIYGNNVEEEPDYYRRNLEYKRILRSVCPISGQDNILVPLDLQTSLRFDNRYYHNILQGKGLLFSDQALLSDDLEGDVARLVWAYASDQELFFRHFVKSMRKMGRISLLKGNQGEIRHNCRYINSL